MKRSRDKETTSSGGNAPLQSGSSSSNSSDDSSEGETLAEPSSEFGPRPGLGFVMNKKTRVLHLIESLPADDIGGSVVCHKLKVQKGAEGPAYSGVLVT